MTLLEFVNKKIAIEVIVAQLFILGSIFYLLFLRKKYPVVEKFLGKYGLIFAFLISLIATSSSLFYSNIAHFPPCDLCWFQRIFMYPLVIMLGIALFKKDIGVIRYALPISIVGFFIALYHNVIYYSNGGLSSFCNFLASGVSCTKRYIFEFGYITIPMMALTAFALIIIFLVFTKLQLNSSERN